MIDCSKRLDVKVCSQKLSGGVIVPELQTYLHFPPWEKKKKKFPPRSFWDSEKQRDEPTKTYKLKWCTEEGNWLTEEEKKRLWIENKDGKNAKQHKKEGKQTTSALEVLMEFQLSRGACVTATLAVFPSVF